MNGSWLLQGLGKSFTDLTSWCFHIIARKRTDLTIESWNLFIDFHHKFTVCDFITYKRVNAP